MNSTPRLDDSPAPANVADFERSLEELETLVQTMERGEMSLEDALQAFDRGMQLVRGCQGALAQAELRVRVLTDPLDPDSATPFTAQS